MFGVFYHFGELLVLESRISAFVFSQTYNYGVIFLSWLIYLLKLYALETFFTSSNFDALLKTEMLCASDSANKGSILYFDAIIGLVFCVHLNHLIAELPRHCLCVILDVFFVNDFNEATENANLNEIDQEVTEYHEGKFVI